MATQTFKQVVQSGLKFSYSEISKIILSELSGYRGRPDVLSVGNNNPVTKMYALCGPHGMGKTYFIKKFAALHKIPVRRIVFGEKEVEDALGIPSEESEERGHHSMLAPPGFPAEPPEISITGKYDLIPGRDVSGSSFSGKGILLINEFCTANAKQESQLRSLISDRMIGDHRVGDGWLIIGDTNPLDHKYHTVNQLDESVQSRVFLLPVESTYEDAMTFWQASGHLSPIMYSFLRLNRDFWKEVDNRRWVAAGDAAQCLIAGSAPEAVIGKTLAVALNEVISSAFLKFRHYGDDPYYYPILANDYMSASETVHEGHMKLIERWKKDATKGTMVSVTAADLKDWVSQHGRAYTDSKAKEVAVRRIATMLLQVGTAQGVDIFESVDKPLVIPLYEALRGTAFEKHQHSLSMGEYKNKIAAPGHSV